MQQISSKKPVLGIIESISFPELGVSEVLAKVDTGAYSGAIHCESIKEIVNPLTGKKALEIVPIGPEYEPVVIDKFARTYTTSSSGHRIRRYLINTTMSINGESYPIKIGITKRHMMNMKVLIGRRFLRKNNMIVDVSLNAELDNDGGRKL